ncbi:heterogeneous nuclear ribonucleoprotein A/B-like isoform X1 [Equus caballus]|uniref:heterogeneous nuclear ribonucleoprotein A/B-like isoform X1 n=2 Tax=Equus caballus TaxID=9796 RepID=UPI0038B3B96F
MGRAQQRARGSAACLPGMSQAAEGEQPLETTGAAESRHEAAPEGESPAETAGPSTRSQTGDEADLVNRSGNEEDAGKWFVGSLSWDISKKDPKDYFTKLREVVDHTIKMDPNIGRSRGLGFILFKDVASVEKVLDQKERKVGGHRMNHKKAVTMKKDPMKKIFVGGLNPEATEEKIREYFGKFGEIEAIEFSLDPESNKRQGSVFIAFKEEEPVRSILEKFHTISGSKPPWYIVVYSSLWVLLVVACGMLPQRGLTSSAMSAPRIRSNETLGRLQRSART